MPTKQIFSIIIIIIAFGGAMVMGYLALSKLSPQQKVQTQNLETKKSSVLIQGERLDFEQLQTYNINNKLFPYPVVTKQEIGVNLGKLID